MARRSSSRARAGTNRIFVILAVAVIGLLMIGSVAAVFSSSGDSDNIELREEPAVRITPGEEVSRLETVIAEHPEDADSIVVLAEVLSNSGRVSVSVPWYERAVELRPDDATLRIAFGRALQRNRGYFDAEVQFKQALEVDPDHQAAAFYLANLYEKMPTPRIAEAREWYKRTIEADPDSVIAGQARDRLAELAEPDVAPTVDD